MVSIIRSTAHIFDSESSALGKLLAPESDALKLDLVVFHLQRFTRFLSCLVIPLDAGVRSESHCLSL